MSDFLQKEVSLLRSENSLLREQIEYLTQILAPDELDFSVEAGLTSTESRVLTLLLNKTDRVCSKVFMAEALYAIRVSKEIPDIKIIDVYISKLRKKLRDFEITIETSWGQGYCLTKANAERLLELKGMIWEDFQKSGKKI